MKRLLYALGIYTIVGFFLFPLIHLFGPHLFGPHRGSIDPALVGNMRMASIVFMICYGTIATVMYSGAKVLD